MEYLEANLEDVLNEIKGLMETQGDLTRDSFYELIDEVLEDKREDGELPDDYNFPAAREMLRRRWSEIEAEISA